MATESATDILARTLWGEARGEGPRGMHAVASVICNRLLVARRHGGRYWWGGRHRIHLFKTVPVQLLEPG